MAAAEQDIQAAQFGLEDFSSFSDGMPVLDEEDEEDLAKSYPAVAVILGSSHDLGTGTLFITTRYIRRHYDYLEGRPTRGLRLVGHHHMPQALVQHRHAGGSSGKGMLAADEGCMLIFKTSTCTPSPAIRAPPGSPASTCSWSPAPQPSQTQLKGRLMTMKTSPLKCGLCLKTLLNVSVTSCPPSPLR